MFKILHNLEQYLFNLFHERGGGQELLDPPFPYNTTIPCRLVLLLDHPANRLPSSKILVTSMSARERKYSGGSTDPRGVKPSSYPFLTLIPANSPSDVTVNKRPVLPASQRRVADLPPEIVSLSGVCLAV